MGNGIIREAPDYENFRKFTEEYDKLKNAGLSTEEMHGILCHRLKTMSRSNNGLVQPAMLIVDSGGGKEDAIRASEAANTSHEKSTNVPMLGNGSAKQALQQKVNLPPQNHHNGLVLLIDDSSVAAKVASKVLVQLHFEVVTANSAKMGFDILMNRKEDIDLIFLDVVMPTVDGVECLSWIKDNADVAHIPVYMLSGLEDQMLTDVCLERGAEGMLLKPLNPDMVRTIMNSHNLGIKDIGISAQSDVPSSSLSSKPTIAQSLSVVIPKTEMDDRSAKVSNSIHGGKKLTTNSLVIGSQAPAFKLVDSDFNEYVFPNPNSRKNVLLLFIPTIFCTHIFEETGFLMRFFGFYEQLLKSNTLFVACITADLPYALKAAKKRFKLPFTLLSDPSLFVAQRYVGSVDIGKLMTKFENFGGSNNKTESNNCDHPQNSFIGPSMGMVLLNRKRDVLNKWVAKGDLFESKKSLQQGQYPDNFEEWVTMSHDVGGSSPRRTPTSSIPRIDPEPLHDPKEEIKNSKRPETRTTTISSLVHAQVDPIVGPNDQPTKENNKMKLPTTANATLKPNILVVDDSSVSSRVCSKKLELLGFNVNTAYNGQQAFDQLKKKSHGYYSMILSDVVMPVCDGIGLLKLIKNDDLYKDIPIVMMSGLEGEELSKNCLDLGANALLKKPFDDIKFLEAIKGFDIKL